MLIPPFFAQKVWHIEHISNVPPSTLYETGGTDEWHDSSICITAAQFMTGN